MGSLRTPIFIRIDSYVVNLTTLSGWDRDENGYITLFGSDGDELLVLDADQARKFEEAVAERVGIHDVGEGGIDGLHS